MRLDYIHSITTLPISGCSLSDDAILPNQSVHTVAGRSVRVDWQTTPTVEQIAQLNAEIAANPYKAWADENGDNPKKTRKRQLRAAFNDESNLAMVAVRALIAVVAKRLDLSTTDTRQMQRDVLDHTLSLIDEGI